MLPADEVYGVYGRRLEGRIAVADSAVIAVDRKAQWPGQFRSSGGPLSAMCTPFEGRECPASLLVSPYLAIHLLEERIALLVAFLVITH